VNFEIYFDSGIDDFGGWLQVLKDHKMVSQGGAWYTYKDPETDTEIKFQSKDFEDKMLGDPELKERLYNRMCEAMIMSYKSGKLGIDDIEISEEPVPTG
jgi:hypothetical protein